jgi:hypothetical protein
MGVMPNTDGGSTSSSSGSQSSNVNDWNNVPAGAGQNTSTTSSKPSPFVPHNYDQGTWTFYAGGSGNHSPDSNDVWNAHGYSGIFFDTKADANRAFIEGKLPPGLMSWLTSNLPAISQAAGKSRGFKSAKTAWDWIVTNSDRGTGEDALTWLTSLPGWPGNGGPSSPSDGGPGSRGGGGGGGGGPQTRVDRSYNITDPETAKMLVNSLLSNYLGREASNAEVTTFTQALNAAERKNPVVTTSTATPTSTGVDQTSTTTGGLDSAGRQQVILDQLSKTPEYQAVQTDSVFRKAMSVLAGGGL